MDAASWHGPADHAKNYFVSQLLHMVHIRFSCMCWDVGEQHIGPVAPVSLPPSLTDGSETHPMHGYRIGVFWDWFNDATPEVVDCCKSALNILCAKGAEVGSHAC